VGTNENQSLLQVFTFLRLKQGENTLLIQNQHEKLHKFEMSGNGFCCNYSIEVEKDLWP